jgi:hypothetical protein
MTHRLIVLVSLFHAHHQGSVQLRTCRLHAEVPAGTVQDTGHQAYVHRTVGSTPRAGQLHSVQCAPVPASPQDVCRISFCTVSAPIRFLRASSDSPGSSRWALRRLCRSRWSAPHCGKACRHRLTIEQARHPTCPAHLFERRLPLDAFHDHSERELRIVVCACRCHACGPFLVCCFHCLLYQVRDREHARSRALFCLMLASLFSARE